MQSLRALKPQLTAEIKSGFRSSPLHVCRLAYRAAIVYALAALSWLPGPQRKLIQRFWPRLVEHLATTMELNHERVLRVGDPPARVRSWLVRARDWCAEPAARVRCWWGEGLSKSFIDGRSR